MLLFWIAAADVVLLLAFGVPIFLLYSGWKRWVNRLSDHARPFEKPRRFGFRSWAARSFALDVAVDRVKQQLDNLTEITLEEVTALLGKRGPSRLRDMGSFSFASLAPLSGQQTFPTGIEIEWTDPETAELHSLSYADWPLNPEDDAQLPMKQRQMLFRRALLYVESEGEKRTRISCELQAPAWAYFMFGMVLLLIVWAGWMLWHVFGARAVDPGAARLEQANIILMGAALAWISTRIVEVLRLQSISLLDNVISTFGPLLPRASRSG